MGMGQTIAVNGFANGQILFGNGSTNIGVSSRLFWDNTNKYLAVRVTGAETPAYPLDIFGASRFAGQALFTNTTSSTSPTTGGAVFSGGVGIGGDQHIAGFTSFGGTSGGHPAIKEKLIEGTTPLTEGSQLSYAHGLNSSKIQGASIIIEYSTGYWVPLQYESTTYKISYTIDPVSLNVQTISGASSSVLGKNFRALIKYGA